MGGRADRVPFSSPPRAGRAEWGGFLGLLAAGTLLRVLLWSTQSLVSVDGTNFIRMARQLAGGPSVASVQQYGYPAAIALAHLLIPDWVTAARVVALAGGLAMLPLVWLVARSVVRRPWLSLLPVAAVALLPLPVRYSLTTMSDSLYLALLFGVFLAVLRGRRFPGGLLGGLAYAVRPEALLAVLGIAVLELRRSRKGAALLLGGALLVSAAYFGAQGLWLGKWTLSQKTINLAASTWQGAEETVGGETVPLGAGKRLRTFGLVTVRAYPGRLADATTELLRQGGWWVPAGALAGLSGPGLVLAAGLLQFFLLPVSFLAARSRYVLPSLPFLWILAAVAIDRLRRTAWVVLAAIVCVLGLGLSAWTERPLYTEQEDGDFTELKVAGEALAPVVGEGDVVYDRKPYVAFYAGAQGRYIPTGSYDEVLDFVVREGGDYLVVNDAVARAFRPELLPLVTDPDRIRSERRLAPVYFSVSSRGVRTIVYRVVRPGGPPPRPGEGQVAEGIDRYLRSQAQ